MIAFNKRKLFHFDIEKNKEYLNILCGMMGVPIVAVTRK
jgi:hypothetical protein